MLYKMVICSIILLSASCSSSHVDYNPSGDSLPNGKVGVIYKQEITIGAGLEDNPAFLTDKNASVNIYPSDIGLYVVTTNKRKDGLPIYNHIIITGVPLKSGEVKVSISGYTYGSMYTKTSRIDKTYSLEIK